MSESAQGPGWWIASDGKWYPPEQHPDARAEEASAPALAEREINFGPPEARGAGGWDEFGLSSAPVEVAPSTRDRSASLTGVRGRREGGRGRGRALALIVLVLVLAGGGIFYAVHSAGKGGAAPTTTTPGGSGSHTAAGTLGGKKVPWDAHITSAMAADMVVRGTDLPDAYTASGIAPAVTTNPPPATGACEAVDGRRRSFQAASASFTDTDLEVVQSATTVMSRKADMRRSISMLRSASYEHRCEQPGFTSDLDALFSGANSCNLKVTGSSISRGITTVGGYKALDFRYAAKVFCSASNSTNTVHIDRLLVPVGRVMVLVTFLSAVNPVTRAVELQAAGGVVARAVAVMAAGHG